LCPCQSHSNDAFIANTPIAVLPLAVGARIIKTSGRRRAAKTRPSCDVIGEARRGRVILILTGLRMPG
jgi:hypothetical protein